MNRHLKELESVILGDQKETPRFKKRQIKNTSCFSPHF